MKKKIYVMELGQASELDYLPATIKILMNQGYGAFVIDFSKISDWQNIKDSSLVTAELIAPSGSMALLNYPEAASKIQTFDLSPFRMFSELAEAKKNWG
jgi:hypothetical protein